MIAIDPRLPHPDGSPTYMQRLLIRLYEIVFSHASEINKVTAYATSAPTTGDHFQSQFVWNLTPTEQGTAGSKYVVLGWSCVVSGSPGTWVACRCLTGN